MEEEEEEEAMGRAVVKADACRQVGFLSNCKV